MKHAAINFRKESDERITKNPAGAGSVIVGYMSLM
jgi:hypothetical protein